MGDKHDAAVLDNGSPSGIVVHGVTTGDPNSDYKTNFEKARRLDAIAKLAEYRKIDGITADDVDGRWPFEINPKVDFAKVGGSRTSEDAEAAPSGPVYVSLPDEVAPKKRSFWLWKHFLPPNRSCYHNTISMHWCITWYYYVSITFIYTALLAQVVFGATISATTATGNDNRTATTILSTFITVLGAILAWMKGVGIPHRTLQYKYALGRVRYYIEFMDSQFQCAALAEKLNPVEEAWAIVKMYWAVNNDYVHNRPDVYSRFAEAQAVKQYVSWKDPGQATGTGSESNPTAAASGVHKAMAMSNLRSWAVS